MNRKIILNHGSRIIFTTPDKRSYFFGYYNYSPISRDGTKMLAHKTFFEGRMPTREDRVEIGYFDLKTQKWYKITESGAFNWQQGSMLQWLGPDSNTKFIFNDVVDNRFVSRIADIENGTIKTIPHAIYGIDPQGEFSISLNFERCYWTRAYSYASVKDENWNKNIPSEDGILKIDLKTGIAQRIISIQEIVNLSNGNDQIPHWIEHIMLNPNSDRFSFYHRYGSKSNFLTKVITADIDGKNIWQHPYNDGDRYSHLGWRDNYTYILYTISQSKTQTSYKKFEEKNSNSKLIIALYRKYLKLVIPRNFAKSIMRTKKYYALTVDKNKIIEIVDPGILNQDGHPSFTRDGRFMLTDTYEDKNSYRHLLLYDSFSKKLKELGRFFSTYNSCGWRADLHPRFSYDEQFVIIDSNHNGYHQILILKLDWARLKKQL